MRRNEVQNESMTGDKHDRCCRQDHEAQVMSFHGFDPLRCNGRDHVPGGTVARTNCKSFIPTAPLSTALKPASVSRPMMSRKLT